MAIGRPPSQPTRKRLIFKMNSLRSRPHGFSPSGNSATVPTLAVLHLDYEDQVRSIVGARGEYVAQVDDDGRFQSLLDRCALLQVVARGSLMDIKVRMRVDHEVLEFPIFLYLQLSEPQDLKRLAGGLCGIPGESETPVHLYQLVVGAGMPHVT